MDIRLPCKYQLLLHLQDNLHLVEKFLIDLKYNVANRFQQYPENSEQLVDKLMLLFVATRISILVLHVHFNGNSS